MDTSWYDFGSSNNGNVSGITNNVDTNRSLIFTYDALNRIKEAKTTSTYSTSPTKCWGNSFTADAFSNLTGIGVASSSYTGCTQENLSITVSATTNRITTSGYTYDSSGNLTQTPSPGSLTMTYDAEGKMTSVAGVTYTYDGDGIRVKKSSGTLYWYGIAGDLLAETDTSGNTTYENIFLSGSRIARRDSSGNVYYYFSDHLGSSRVITNATGSPCYDADFYPYGGERAYSDSCPQPLKFGTYERDSESGFYYAFARYYDASLGRFTSPDPLGGSAGNPQSHNGYAYVLNNPANLIDPLGLTHDCLVGECPNDPPSSPPCFLGLCPPEPPCLFCGGGDAPHHPPRPPRPPYHVPPPPHVPFGVGGTTNTFLQVPPQVLDPQFWDRLFKLGIATYGTLGIYLASRNKQAQQTIESLIAGLENHLKMLDPSYNPDPDNRDMWKRKLKNKIDQARAKLKRLKGKTLEKLTDIIGEAEKKLGKP